MTREEEKEVQKEALTFYRAEGINFIPLQYKEKKPLFSWKKYQTERLTEEEEDLFFNRGNHNVAAICGSVSDNLFILDFDNEETFKAYFPKKDGLVIVKTGRKEGGYHVYFKADKSIKILKCFNDAGQEVLTLKGEASYCVGAGSVHPSGELYKFIQKGEIPILKGNVREDIKTRAALIGLNFGASEKSEEIDIEALLKGVLEGGRDSACTHIIHYLRRQGTEYEEAHKILQNWNVLNNPPIPGNELHEKLNYHFMLPEPYKFFYKTNPSQYVITPDLELKSTIEVTPPMDIADVFYLDEKNRECIDDEKLLAFIDSYLTFVCISDTKELLFYKNGIYVDELGRLDAFLEKHLSVKASIRFKAEVRKHIQDRNSIDREEINEDKIRIPVKNGLLNLNTRELEAFSEDKVYTSALNAIYDPAITAPEFLKFVREILPAEEIPMIQEMFGYCIWQGYPSAKTFWLIGEGGNGKTVLTSVLAALLDSVKNVSHIALNEMTGQHRFAGYELYGKLANIVPEPSTVHALETPFLKAITGESIVSVERKGVQKRLHFVNFAKVIVEANSVPRIADEKQALWDRIIAIEFPYTFRGREGENPEILKTLITPDSLSGVLNWALEGLARLRTNNWRFSGSVWLERIKISMQIQSNPILAFKENWLLCSRHAEILAHTVYDAYNLFSVLNNTESLFKGAITKALEEDNRIGLHRVRREGGRPYVFQGCELSSKIICCYGMYQNRPLKLGEFDELEEDANVEVRTCSLENYCLEYPEPVAEIQEVIGEKLIIFNSSELVSVYKNQMKVGPVKHCGPQEVVYEPEAPKKTDIPLFLKALSPLEEGLCERCGKQGFLSHELTDEEGLKSLVCMQCSKEVEAKIGKLTPPVFGTTLQERRDQIKKEEEKEKK